MLVSSRIDIKIDGKSLNTGFLTINHQGSGEKKHTEINQKKDPKIE